MKNLLLCMAALMVLSQCIGTALRPTPDVALQTNVALECLSQFADRKQLRPDRSQCSPLEACVAKQAKGTVLATYPTHDAWRAFENVTKSYAGDFPRVSQMRTNANGKPAKVQEMLQLILSIRNACLIETGLRDQIRDT